MLVCNPEAEVKISRTSLTAAISRAKGARNTTKSWAYRETTARNLLIYDEFFMTVSENIINMHNL
jgi:hypothetical protein